MAVFSATAIGLAFSLVSPVQPAPGAAWPVAQQEAAEGVAPPRPAVRAAERSGPIQVDGRPQEAAWREAEVATSFVQGEPVENAPAEEPSRVRVLYDPSALYVSAVMLESDPSQIGDQLVRRDETGQYDYFEVSLDPNNDRRTAYRFRVSAAGVQQDVYLYDDVREDAAWDAVWESAVARDSAAWSVEIRIPLSQLRYNAADTVQSWGVNFSRRRLNGNERTFFALQSRLRHGVVSVFGRLEGLYLPNGAKRMEFRPYALTRARTAPAEAENPFFDGSDLGNQVGLDMRLGLGAAYTVDLTVNPDFGQVEVDPAVINLTAFETFFPEKRPFFVEVAQIFEFDLAGRRNQLFYSRRIGREPHGTAPDGVDYDAIPNETTILGAAKLTGRTPGGLSLGALAAVTGEEAGEGFTLATEQTSRFVVEPATGYGVARVQQDFRDGATQAGAMLTGVHRKLPESTQLDFLTSDAYSLGLDFEHNWGGPNSRDWALWGYFAGTHIRGSSEAITEVQTSSNHYFQRPDATRFSLDSTATSLTGSSWRLQFERQSAKHWTGAIWIGEITPGFEANDLGFVQSSERLDAGFRISYQEITPGDLFRSYEIRFFSFQNWRHEALDDVFSLGSWDRAHKNGTFNLRTDFEFLNYWNLDLNADFEPETLSDSETRGGPLMIDPASKSFGVSLATDRRATLFLEPRVEYEDRHRGGHRWETSIQAVFRPSPSLELQLQPAFATELDPAQYVETSDDLGFAPTFGRRYVFSDLRRRQFSLETHLNLAFSPTLTFQLFAQPLISSGDFQTYKALARAESFEFDTFEEGRALVAQEDVRCLNGQTCVDGDTRYIDFDADGTTDLSFSDQDFSIRSLRLNTVLRWEYRPGSTLFLVWQQNRRERADLGSFDFGRDLDALRNIAPENVFILKVNYWLGL